MDTIGQTNVHYIRCIKPNEAKVAWEFEPNMVLSQLRACGVLETIRISCAGYPSRWTFEEFADRYYALVPSKHWDHKENPDMGKLCTTILEASIKDNDKYQVGITKIFFRAGQVRMLLIYRFKQIINTTCNSLLIWKSYAPIVSMNVLSLFRRIFVAMFIAHVIYACNNWLWVFNALLDVKWHRPSCNPIVKKELLLLFKPNGEDMLLVSSILRHVNSFSSCKQVNQDQDDIEDPLFITSFSLLAIRGCRARRNLSSVKEHMAATQIQRLVRGW